MSKNEDVNNEKQVGDYLLNEEIGSGGFAKVVLGTHIPTGEKVAIKIMDKEQIYADELNKQRVLNEIAILKIVRHNNIIKLYEVMESSKKIYLVMENCDRGELFDYIVEKKHLTEKQACTFFQEIIDALSYLHSQNIVHRDIKPENILLETFGKSLTCKLIDFGISRTYTLDKLIGTPCGTASYAPPEMHKGEEYYGLLSDIWSAGVLLYAMVFGYLPFCEDDEDKNIENIVKGNYEIPPEASKDLADLLKHILDIDPSTRYDIDQIKQHPWFNIVSPIKTLPGLILTLHKIPIDERILKVCQAYDYNPEEVRESVMNNKYDNKSSIYYIILNKMKREGYDSISDLFSKAYLDYINDPKNWIDNEKKDSDEDNSKNNSEKKDKENEKEEKNKVEPDKVEKDIIEKREIIENDKRTNTINNNDDLYSDISSEKNENENDNEINNVSTPQKNSVASESKENINNSSKNLRDNTLTINQTNTDNKENENESSNKNISISTPETKEKVQNIITKSTIKDNTEEDNTPSIKVNIKESDDKKSESKIEIIEIKEADKENKNIINTKIDNKPTQVKTNNKNNINISQFSRSFVPQHSYFNNSKRKNDIILSTKDEKDNDKLNSSFDQKLTDDLKENLLKLRNPNKKAANKTKEINKVMKEIKEQKKSIVNSVAMNKNSKKQSIKIVKEPFFKDNKRKEHTIVHNRNASAIHHPQERKINGEQKKRKDISSSMVKITIKHFNNDLKSNIKRIKIEHHSNIEENNYRKVDIKSKKSVNKNRYINNSKYSNELNFTTPSDKKRYGGRQEVAKTPSKKRVGVNLENKLNDNNKNNSQNKNMILNKTAQLSDMKKITKKNDKKKNRINKHNSDEINTITEANSNTKKKTKHEKHNFNFDLVKKTNITTKINSTILNTERKANKTNHINNSSVQKNNNNLINSERNTYIKINDYKNSTSKKKYSDISPEKKIKSGIETERYIKNKKNMPSIYEENKTEENPIKISRILNENEKKSKKLKKLKNIFKGPIDIKNIIISKSEIEVNDQLVEVLNKYKVKFWKMNSYKFYCNKNGEIFIIEIFLLSNKKILCGGNKDDDDEKGVSQFNKDDNINNSENDNKNEEEKNIYYITVLSKDSYNKTEAKIINKIICQKFAKK